MEDLILDYFKHFFLASNSTKNLEFLSGLKGHVTKNMNRELSKEFIADEVYQAFIQIYKNSYALWYVACVLSKILAYCGWVYY